MKPHGLALRFVTRKIITKCLRQAIGTIDNVCEAGDGIEGLAQLENNKDINLIFSDINMPNMGGLEFVEQAHKKYPLIKIVMITTEGGEDEVKRAIFNGAVGYIKKPFTADIINATLSKIGL